MKKEEIFLLADKARGGNADALSRLLELTYQDLYYYAYATVKNEEQAADVTQESCLEIMTTIANLREPGAFLTWAKRIVYHQCTRYFREVREVPLEEDEDGLTLLDKLPDENPGSLPEQVQEDREFRQLLQNMLDGLPAPQRSALMLYYYEKLSVGQIAQIQATTEGTVKSRLNYGRKAMKEQVETYEKKSGIRLHSIAPLPVLLYFLFQNEAIQVAASGAIAAGAGAAAGTTVAAASTAAGTGTAAAGTAAGTGAATAAGISLGTKIAIGSVAAAITLGTTVGIAVNNAKEPELPEEYAAIVQELEGEWVNSDAYNFIVEDACFYLSSEGVMEYGDDTYYLSHITQEQEEYNFSYILSFSTDSRDYGSQTKDSAALYMWVGRYTSDDYPVEYCCYMGSEFFTSPDYKNGIEYELMGVYTEENDMIPSTDAPLEDTLIVGSWISQLDTGNTLELMEDGTARYAGQELRWQLEPPNPWAENHSPELHRFLKLKDLDGTWVYSIEIWRRNDQNPYLVLLPPNKWYGGWQLGYYSHGQRVDLMYRQEDYPGYIRKELTPENAMNYMEIENELSAWCITSDTVDIVIRHYLSFSPEFSASHCVPQLLLEAQTVKIRVNPVEGQITYPEILEVLSTVQLVYGPDTSLDKHYFAFYDNASMNKVVLELNGCDWFQLSGKYQYQHTGEPFEITVTI